MFRKIFYYVTHWETWHWFAKYIIIGPVWVWLCIKAKSLWFFTPSNPGIIFGGFLGETKKEIYDQLPDGSYPNSTFVDPKQSFNEVEQRIVLHGLHYPLAVKPNAGMMGYMFRKIESREQLRQYHAAMKVEYVAQQFCALPIEVSVFYCRLPGKSKGKITGFVRKDCMSVTGNGVSTLKELILQYPRALFLQRELFSKHAGNLNDIIKAGEDYILSDALNLSRGGNIVSLEHENDERLLKIFDELSYYSGFYYGRYDIKCSSVEDLKQGKFVILEFNGCGGEAHHVYGGFSFINACRVLIQHWIILYEISRHNKNKGIVPWNYNDGAEFMANARKHFHDLKQLDAVFSFKPEKIRTVDRYRDFVGDKDFPCIAARAALARDQIKTMVCDHLACPKDDMMIATFLQSFVNEYRSSSRMYNSAVVIFEGPLTCSEEEFDRLMWQRLQGISDHDLEKYKWDSRVSSDPSDPNFSFSVGEEAFYIIGLHPGSNRKSRQFKYPALVFNPHHQFEELRQSGKYSIMKETVRKRDVAFSGSVNPMLADFGQSSEVYQYSGRAYDKDWKCPFVSNNERDEHNTTP